MQLTSKTKGICVLLGVLAAIGVGTWIYQLVNGLGVTGMSNVNSWGTYIIMFMLFVGLSAGGLIVASSAHVFNIKSFKPLALPAVICSTVCICLAGMFILIDLGGIVRIWRILTGPNFVSPLLWDMCVITCYLVINILDLVWISKGAEERVRKLSYVALPVAILVHSVTAWIFGLQIAREWYTAIMAPIFVASALDSGLALLIVCLVALDRAGIAEFPVKLQNMLGKLLATFVAVDAFFIGCEVLTMAYPGAGQAQALAIMATGQTAPFFWFEMIGGLLIPFLLLAGQKRRNSTSLVVTASLLVVLGVFCKRCWLLLTSFVEPNMYGAPGISLGTHAAQTGGQATWALTGSYMPTLPEVIIVIGVLALGGLAFTLLSQYLIKGRTQTQGAAGEAHAAKPAEANRAAV
ncbi:MAG: NrfD/PsrC family molybdoenzyme membrane anchor subunit [Eggerthellaceae bacterium]|jgi:molybdopterin-containing oxidoreductase family membrane subunit